ncbi:MAG TPA: YihY/virulence factor BrkB family protein [Thermomicrobiales bacterium]|nr:YihY/virulence factor BrkB family protein [Thermomicrobiales bacterium]
MRIPCHGNATAWEIAKRSVMNYLRHDMMTYASSLSYTILFALFPFMIFLVALVSFLQVPDFFDWLLEQAARALPDVTYEWFASIIEQIREPQGGLLSVGAAIAIWTASSGFRAIMKALNAAYEVQETRPAWATFPLSIIYTIGLGMLLALGGALALLNPNRFEWLAEHASLSDAVVTVWGWLRFPILIIVLTLAAAIIYHVTPNVKQPFKLLSPGAVFTVVIWVVGSQGFSIYIENFGDYNAYGSLAGAIIFMTFVFLSCSVLLLGGEINAELFRKGRADGHAATDSNSHP